MSQNTYMSRWMQDRKPVLRERRRIMGDDPSHLLVLLHGLGTTGADLFPLTDMLAPLFQQVGGVVVVAPDAPHLAFGGAMGSEARQWFDFTLAQPYAQDPTQAFNQIQHIEKMVHQSSDILTTYLEQLLQETSLPSQRTFVLGFSQGAMMALYVGLRLSHPLAGIIALSGLLPSSGDIYDKIMSRPPVLLGHGKDDAVVPFQAATVSVDMLHKLDVNVETLFFDGLGHGIDDRMLRGVQKFMAQRIVSPTGVLQIPNPAAQARRPRRDAPKETRQVLLPQVALTERRLKNPPKDGVKGTAHTTDTPSPSAEQPQDRRPHKETARVLRSTPSHEMSSPTVETGGQASGRSSTRRRSMPRSGSTGGKDKDQE